MTPPFFLATNILSIKRLIVSSSKEGRDAILKNSKLFERIKNHLEAEDDTVKGLVSLLLDGLSRE